MASTPPARATARRPLLRTVATVAESATLTIRPARAEDLAAGVDACNAGIAERLATFETEPRTIQDIAGWIDDGQPFIVAEHAGRVLGWREREPIQSAASTSAGRSSVPTGRCQMVGTDVGICHVTTVTTPAGRKGTLRPEGKKPR